MTGKKLICPLTLITGKPTCCIKDKCWFWSMNISNTDIPFCVLSAFFSSSAAGMYRWLQDNKEYEAGVREMEKKTKFKDGDLSPYG